MSHDYAPFLTPTTYSDHRHFLREVIPSLDAAQLVELLYQVAVAMRMNGQPQKSFKTGQVVHLIGRRLKNPYATGLGDMLRGDARNAQLRLPSAWHYLMKSRSEFAPADDFNRARPVIGLLFAALSVNKVTEITGNVFDEAEQSFLSSKDNQRLITLYRNRGILYRNQGHFADLNMAKHWFDRAYEVAGTDESQKLVILGDLATLSTDWGDGRSAKAYLEEIYIKLKVNDFRRYELMALQNLAYAEKLLGHYRIALQRLDELLDSIEDKDKENLELYVAASLTKLECYLDLNKFEAVESLARHLLTETAVLPVRELSILRYTLAQALIALGDYVQASEQIQKIIQIETGKDQDTPSENYMRVMQARLLLGQLALRQDNSTLALVEGDAALRFFSQTQQSREQAAAHLLMAKGHLEQNALFLAEHHACGAVAIGQQIDAQLILYRAYILLGHVRRAQSDLIGAKAYYEQAFSIIEQSERNLTVLLRPGFLGDKGEPLQALTALHLDQPEPSFVQREQAFEILERSKSRAFLEYLVDNNGLEVVNDPLTEKLDQFRSDYLAFSNKAGDESADRNVRNAARQKADQIKEAMAETVRRVYQNTEKHDFERLHDTPTLAGIQRYLAPDALLIEYYNDGHTIYVFAVDCQQVTTYRLDATMVEVLRQSALLEKRAQAKLAMLKTVPAEYEDPIAILRHPYLNDIEDNRAFNQAAAALYNALIRPLAAQINGHETLIIVPYGQLHDLPFHLLYDTLRRDGTGGRHLIQDYQVVMLPAASLLTRPPLAIAPHRRLVLYDDWQTRLRHSHDDGEQIAALLDGELVDAGLIDVRAVLARARGQILHIVAHGQFDSLHPELSFIQMGHEQLMMTDLFRLGLAFQLVTLTSCEAGKLKLVEYTNIPSTGDDLIGLGRAFLYTGTRALLISRWHIGDGLTMPVVKPFYEAILNGEDKAHALRGAQLALFEMIPTLHPMLWGVFQLIGDAAPLV